MRKLFTLVLFLFSSISFSQTQILNLNVNEIRGTDNNDGCADYDSVFVRTTGVVYGRNFRPNGLQMSLVEKRADTLLSNRCGIGLFKLTMDLPVTLNEGDSISVVGFVNCFNGLTQIRPDTIVILKTGCQLTQPRVVSDINELSESFLVKIPNAEFIPSSWPASPPPTGINAKAFIGTPGTTDYKEFTIRIDNDCDLYGQSVPTGKVDIVGIGGQFDSSSPRTEGYQLLPRSAADITPAAPVELPLISFQDTTYTFTEGSAYSIPVKSTQNVTSQVSCLVVSQDLTTTSQDYLIQSPSIVTFPLGISESNFGFNLNSDNENESDEVFYLKLRKISDNYAIGSDSVTKITILGTTSTKQLQNFDFYKNSFNGTLSVKLPNNFKGTVNVYNSMGLLVLTSKDDMVNQDLLSLTTKTTGIYRAVFTTDKNRFVKSFIN